MVVVLLAIFTALALSVVNARGPIDGSVQESFDATIAKAGGKPSKCTKTRVDFYACTAVVRPLAGGRAEEVRYILWVIASGCWTTTTPKVGQRGRFRLPGGCIASG